jgi:hypothetical protein
LGWWKRIKKLFTNKYYERVSYPLKNNQQQTRGKK